MKKPITIEDHQSSRFIAEPLHLLDYCLINDGGVALIVTTAERARDLPKPPVYVRGFGTATKLVNSRCRRTISGTRRCRAWRSRPTGWPA